MIVYVEDFFPHYRVIVDGKVYDKFSVRDNMPLTWSQQWDIAAGYKEALSD